MPRTPNRHRIHWAMRADDDKHTVTPTTTLCGELATVERLTLQRRRVTCAECALLLVARGRRL